MEHDKSKETLAAKIKRKLGFVASNTVNPETGRSRAEEHMISVMYKRGSKGFNIARSAETGLKHYERPPEE